MITFPAIRAPLVFFCSEFVINAYLGVMPANLALKCLNVDSSLFRPKHFHDLVEDFPDCWKSLGSFYPNDETFLVEKSWIARDEEDSEGVHHFCWEPCVGKQRITKNKQRYCEHSEGPKKILEFYRNPPNYLARSLPGYPVKSADDLSLIPVCTSGSVIFEPNPENEYYQEYLGPVK